MNVVDTCTGSATPLVSGPMAPSACAAMVRGFSGRSVMGSPEPITAEVSSLVKLPPCKTGPAARYAQTGPGAGPFDGGLPLLLRRAARSRGGRHRAAARPRQHDARR